MKTVVIELGSYRSNPAFSLVAVSLAGSLAVIVGSGRACAATINVGDAIVADPGRSTYGAVVKVDPVLGTTEDISVGTFNSPLMPWAVGLDANRQVIAANKQNALIPSAQVFRINPATGARTVISQGQLLVGAVGLVVDADGSVLVLDQDAPKVIRVNPAGSPNANQTLVSIAQNFVKPTGIALQIDGKILVVDQDAEKIIRIDPARPPTSNQTVLAPNAGSLSGIARTASGTLFYVVDTPGNVRLLQPETGSLSSVCSFFDFDFDSPVAIAVEPGGNILLTSFIGLNMGVLRYTLSNCTKTRVSVGSSWSLPYGIAVVSAPPPPTITLQPQSRTNAVGTTATFLVVATGTAPLSYQWRKNGTNMVNGGSVSGATSTNLSIANVQTNDVGNYTAVVTNPNGSVTSQVATLSVIVPPLITIQPQSRTNLVGTTATFTVAATGTAPLVP